ncbi:THO complex subunit 4B-like [Juglans microcarpa x Juglans regia]|uniref:THO complex subunit 4B-like n=1 Tax=Juglans microcarpa x Juglans regia TaxID=2249226 RepID=UPI001B7F60DE|nr:THO complex subunit 4B-like [Juglans microcarpa x Juglans regia]
MSNKLDMSLDDVIMNSQRSGGYNGNSRGRGGASGLGPDRRFANRTVPRMAPYYTPQPMQVVDSIFQHQMVLGGGSNTDEGTKLYISNLDYDVSGEDLQVLFSEVGDLKRYSIHYDRSGRSKGTAEVVFLRQSDAVAAIKRYNNVELDGKPMKIELVGVSLVTPAIVPPSTSSILGKPIGTFRSGQGLAGHGGWVRGGGSGFGHGPARGSTQRKGHVEKLTAEDLDADLEKYRLETLQTN